MLLAWYYVIRSLEMWNRYGMLRALKRTLFQDLNIKLNGIQ